MRARKFRPFFDTLDGRIVLSDASLVGGVAIGGTVLSAVGATPPTTTGPMPGDEIDNVTGWEWIVAGAPTAPTYDPGEPPIDPYVDLSSTASAPVASPN